jgi:hypothetical protein
VWPYESFQKQPVTLVSNLRVLDDLTELGRMLLERRGHLKQATADLEQVAEVQGTVLAVTKLGIKQRVDRASNDGALDQGAGVTSDDRRAVEDRIVEVCPGGWGDWQVASARPDSHLVQA